MCDFSESYLSKFGGPNYPIRGWMQMIKEVVNEDIVINNAARSGRSSKVSEMKDTDKRFLIRLIPKIMYLSCLEEMIRNQILPDFLTLKHRKKNLIRYINETRKKGAQPILFTSIVRRKFDKQGKLIDTYGDYILAAREVAKEMDTHLIDLHEKTWKLVEGYGPEESKKLFLYFLFALSLVFK